MESEVHVPGLGDFVAQRYDGFGAIFCYARSIAFRGSIAELIIYPNDDGSAITADQSESLRELYLRFDRRMDEALTNGTKLVRELCTGYRIDTNHLHDSHFWYGHRWVNIKLEGEDIECYTYLPSLEVEYDLVLRFSADIRLVSAHFDG